MNNPRAHASSAGFLPWCNNWGLIFGARELEREYSERSDFCPNKWTRVYSQKNCCEKNAFKTLDIKWSAQDVKFPDLYINNHNFVTALIHYLEYFSNDWNYISKLSTKISIVLFNLFTNKNSRKCKMILHSLIFILCVIVQCKTRILY